MSEENFEQLTDSKGFELAHHNETDFGAFLSFQEELDSRYQVLEEERSKRERLANLKKWDTTLPPRWRGANLKTMERREAEEAEELIRRKHFTSFFIRGEAGAGKTFLALAIARRYIALGLVTPSQVKLISEETLLSMPARGFNGANRFDELFEEKYKLYIFDNVGTRETYEKREGPLWEQLLDHIYSRDLGALFTSTGSASYFAERLSTPAASKFRHLVEGCIITMEPRGEGAMLDEPTPEEEARERQADKRAKGAGLFKDSK